MPRPKNRTSKQRVRVEGVAHWRRDIDPARYTYRGTGSPDGADTYMLDGEPHRWDGRCHADCEDVR